MGEFLQVLVSILQFAWPFRPVNQWERGVAYVMGKHWWRWPASKEDGCVGPGRWPVIPYFMDVVAVSVVPAVIGTPLLTVTLTNRKPLMFSAAATVEVTNAADARNEVDDFDETTQELLGAVLADKLARTDPEQLDAENRTKLLASLRAAMNVETQKYGVKVTAIRFTNFVTDVRAYRLMTDTSLSSAGW